MIKFRCSHCDQKLGVPDEYALKRVRCSKCSQPCQVPALPTQSQTPKAAPRAVAVPAPERPLSPAPAPAAIPVTCLICSAAIKADPESAGKIIPCPKCGCYLEVPGKPGAASQAAPKPAGPALTAACPSCDRKLPAQTPVCTQCGIFIKSGRPILTAWDVDADELEEKAHGIVGALSWLIPFGVYPVYSEAMGNHKPFATWGILAATVLISAWFLVLEIAESPKMMSAKNLMLWNTNVTLEAEQIQLFYDYTSYGDRAAFTAKRDELSKTTPEDQLDVAALNALDSNQRCFGEFRFYQLLTHAFLHGGILHLAGNMLFLIVLGSRVNAAIGNIWTVIVYPILAVAAAVTHMLSLGSAPPTPMLGASGAVMGLAGAYLLLFPIHKIYMVIWMRWGLLAGFHLSFKCFAVRGFWVVLFYIMFDIIAVSLMLSSQTAHWAHIGGLIWGILIALGLLAARLVYSRSDILSLVLGKYAWRLIGTPANRMK